MDLKIKIDLLVAEGKVEWKKHALQRIFERSISRDEVKQAIVDGVIIESYLDDYPFPSFLIACVNINRPLHIHIPLIYSHFKRIDCVIV